MVRPWRHRALRPPRRRVFLGCEGESERAYAALLQRFADELGLHLHIERPILGLGAGDPFQKIRRAGQHIAMGERGRQASDRFLVRAVLLDADRFTDPIVAANAWREARERGIALILSEPDHEAFLLRHLPGHADHRPPTGTLLRLQSVWPEYSKPMNADALAGRITLEGLRQACRVETALADFLHRIGVRF